MASAAASGAAIERVWAPGRPHALARTEARRTGALLGSVSRSGAGDERERGERPGHFILATVWFVQEGSPESKKLDEVGTESDADQLLGAHVRPDSPRWARARGFRLWLYSNSLLIVMGTIWIGAWFAQSVTGWSAYNAEQLDHDSATLGWLQYVGTADFWETTLQNWQSEFLAVGSMVVLSIYLRQRGSPESKPVGLAHKATAIES